jgi:hypothetical protein
MAVENKKKSKVKKKQGRNLWKTKGERDERQAMAEDSSGTVRRVADRSGSS